MQEALDYLLGAPLSEDDLICAFRLPPQGPAQGLRAEALGAALSQPDGAVWLHLNITHPRAQRWIERAEFLPVSVREAMVERDTRVRLDTEGDGLFMVTNDLTYEQQSSDPIEIATLWAWANARLVLSARRHPLRTADAVRAALREGMHADSGIDLILYLLDQRSAALRALLDAQVEQVNDIEDSILSERVARQRHRLGLIRRQAARTRRHFRPERQAQRRLLDHPPPSMTREDLATLREIHENLSFLLDENAELLERAKLLQEELASQVAEATNRNLYTLAILTAMFLPMTLITGIFGMNTGGMPGTQDGGSFWLVLLLILASGGSTLGILLMRSKRRDD